MTSARSLDGAEYEIETVSDFAKVPADRLPACLKEFSEYLEFVRALNALGEAVQKEAAIQDPVFTGHKFIWKDDGKPGVSAVNIEVKSAVP